MLPPRLSVSAVSSWRQSFADDLAMWTRLGIDHVGLSLRKCEEAGIEVAALDLRAGGWRVSNVVECGWCALDDPAAWDRQRVRLRRAYDTFGAVLVVTTGPAGRLEWAAAAEAFGDFLAPVVESGAVVAIENTSPLRLDLSFVTTLRDTVDLARMLDAGVCVEVNSCWAERDLAATLLGGAALLAHVQLSDATIGSLCTPDRCVPGDGDIPFARVLRALDEAGYRGALELELVGPRIEAEGYEAAIRRAIDAARVLLAG